MTILLFIVMPLGWALVGKLTGLALAASLFYSERGRRLGRVVGGLCMVILPSLWIAALLIGAAGNAGHGITLFGSAALIEEVMVMGWYGIPILGAYAGAIYVVRDLTIGHEVAIRK